MVVMLSRPEGAGIKQMATELEWKEHSVRRMLSTLKKKLNLTVISEVRDGARYYHAISEQ